MYTKGLPCEVVLMWHSHLPYPLLPFLCRQGWPLLSVLHRPVEPCGFPSSWCARPFQLAFRVLSLGASKFCGSRGGHLSDGPDIPSESPAGKTIVSDNLSGFLSPPSRQPKCSKPGRNQSPSVLRMNTLFLSFFL